MIAPAEVPASSCQWLYPASSAAASPPAKASPLMPPPEKTPSAVSAPRSGVDGASSDMLAAREAWSHRLRALAVEDRHLLLRVALAGDGIRRDRALDRGDLVVAELQLERPQRLVQALGRARTDEGHDVLA